MLAYDALCDEDGISNIANTVATCVDALIPHVLEPACAPSFSGVFGCGLADFDYLAIRCDPATFAGTRDGWTITARVDMEGDWGRSPAFQIIIRGSTTDGATHLASIAKAAR